MDDYRIVRSSFNGEDDDLESTIEKLSVEEEPVSDRSLYTDSLQVNYSGLAQQYPGPVARPSLVVAAKFRERIDRKKDKIPPSVLQVIEEQLSMLPFWESNSGDFILTCNYLDWLTVLPWGEYSDKKFDIFHARRVIDEDHYVLTDFKKRILRFISVAGNSKFVDRLCLCGPPEMGKASIGLSIALALNRKFYQFSVGGLSVAEIKGLPWYIDGMPGKMLQCLKSVGTANPVVLIDDIDKLGERGCLGYPKSAVYGILDPEKNSNYRDNYLGVPIDLSKVLFVCTANDVEKIPSCLLDIMEVIPFNEDYSKKTQEAEMMHFPKAYEHPWKNRAICPGAKWGPEMCPFPDSNCYTDDEDEKDDEDTLIAQAQQMSSDDDQVMNGVAE